MEQGTNLIINADDLGAGEPTDRGIIEAFSKGVVTSASLLANGPSFDFAVKMIQQAGLPVGVHLNLSEGTALSGPITGLTDAAGSFPGKQISRQRFLAGNFDRGELLTELIAQIDRLRRAGLQPDHLDTHQHWALFPHLTQTLIAAAKQVGISRLRLSLSVQPETGMLPASLKDELSLYRHLAPQMVKRFAAAQLVTPDGLLGMPLLNRLETGRLSDLLSGLPAGTWELMVHPGHVDPLRSFSGVEREQELSALTSETIRQVIRRQGIRLINFSELPCAC